MEPPLHGRRRSRPLVEEVRTPLDDVRLWRAEAPAARDRKATPKRSTRRCAWSRSPRSPLIAVGIGILAYTSRPPPACTGQCARASARAAARPGTAPADDSADRSRGTHHPARWREIPLQRRRRARAAGSAPPPRPRPASALRSHRRHPAPGPSRRLPPPRRSRPISTRPRRCRPRPHRPCRRRRSAPAPAADDGDFIAKIERTLERSRGAAERTGAVAGRRADAADAAARRPLGADPAGEHPDGRRPGPAGRRSPNDFLILDTENSPRPRRAQDRAARGRPRIRIFNGP